jgi:taurine dioxygenase
MTVQLRPLGDALGMEVLGIDLAAPLSAATMRAIEEAFAKHPVLVFRNQQLEAADLLRFGRHFGAPQPHILKRYRHPDFAEVSYITNVDADGNIDPVGNDRATAWHTDETYNENLPRLAMLHAIEVPSTAAARSSRTCARPMTPCRARRKSGSAGLPAPTAG